MADTGSVGTTYSHTGLTPRTTWHYRVSAVNAFSAGSPSNVANATTTHQTATGAVRVEELARALKISWDAAQGSRVDGYCLEWREGRINYEFFGCHPNDVIPPARRTHTITGLTPGTEYGVRVRGVGFVSSPDWPQVFGTPLDAKLSRVTATAASETSLQVGWATVPGATGYTVQWRTLTDGRWSTDRQATATSNSHTITGLTTDTRYVVRVQAQLTGGAVGPWSDNVFGTPSSESTLQAVTNLNVETVSATSLKASWTAASGADSYTVQWNNWRMGQRWDQADQSASVTTISHTFTVAASIRGEPWTVRVRPETSAGATGPWAFAEGEQTDLTGPTAFTATAKSSGEVDLTWTAPSAQKTVSKYIVQWRTATNDDGGKIITGAAADEAAVTGLRPDTTYNFYVRALFSSTQESLDATASATTHAVGGAPGKPTGLTATATNEAWIELTWKPATGQGVTGYAIEVSPNGTDRWTSVNRDTGTTVPSYDHGGLQPETTYHYRVLARNSRGTSPWSDTASATTAEKPVDATGDANTPPTFTSEAANQTATEDAAFSYTAPAATDPEDDGLTYTAALSAGGNLPTWLTFTASTRTFSGTPGADDAPAELDITVTATDDGDPPLSATTSFTLTVEEAGARGQANTKPTFSSAAADQTATEDAAFSYTVPAAADAEDDTLTYTAAPTAGGNLPGWLTFTGSSRTFTGTPGANDAPAVLAITVTATDDGDPPLSGTTKFTLAVEAAGGVTGAANTAPAFTKDAADQTATEDATFSYTVPAATDPDSDALTYTATLTGGNGLPTWLTFTGSSRTFSGTPGSDDAPAALAITVTATDDGDPPLTDTTSFKLTVEEKPETLPTADAGSDVEGKRGGDIVLDGTGTPHAEGSQTLTYRWRIDGASHTELAGLGSYLSGTTSADATFAVPRRKDVTDRGALDDGNWIDFELTVTDGDDESATDTTRMTIRGSTWQQVRLSVADAEAKESSGRIDFTVTLDKAGRDPLSVDWKTVDGTATAGNDYTAASGTLTFVPGETSKTVSVVLLDDAIDEGSETFTLQLSNPQPAGTLTLDDGTATGTITNSDPLQAAWLARFGRAVATEAVDALGDRIERRAQARAGGATGTDLSLLQSFFLSGASGSGTAGYGGSGHGRIGHGSAMGGAAAHSLGGVASAPAGMMGQQHTRLGGMPMGGAPMGGAPMGPNGSDADYHLPAGSLLLPGGKGNRWTGWARTSTGHFSSFGGALPLHGRMQMGIFGADYDLGRLLAGVAVAHGRGEGAITPTGLDRAYSAHSTLTSVHPYAAFDLSEDLTLWGQVGYGRGDMALIESHVHGQDLEQAGAYRTGNGLAMAAAGARGALPQVGGFALAVKSDAFLVRTTSDAVTAAASGNLAAGQAGASRLRAAVEGSRALQFAGRSLTPSVELGIRQDGGDAETGLGLETGFGVVYADPSLGLMVDATLSMLVAHQDSRYDEWGFSGSVRFDPGMAGRGLSLNLTPSFGAASQGADRLWAMQDMGGLMPYGAMPFDMGGQLAADIGYGMTGPGGRGTGTPYAGLTRSGMGHRAMRYGWRWEVGRRFNIGVEGARQGGFGGVTGMPQPALGGADVAPAGTQHSLQVRGGVSF